MWPVLTATVIVSAVALGLPLLGAHWLVATTGVFAGFGAMYGLHQVNRRRRRREFLVGALPRAYLPDQT